MKYILIFVAYYILTLLLRSWHNWDVIYYHDFWNWHYPLRNMWLFGLMMLYFLNFCKQKLWV